jgi:CheY-like chemotaxis protein
MATAPTQRRVLIVDDNVDGAAMIAALLELHGAVTKSAASGEEALQIAPTFRPDIVFIDIGMPAMDGFAVLSEMKKLPVVRDARFVALTAWGHGQIGERVKAAGFAHHIQKPASITTLLNEVL